MRKLTEEQKAAMQAGRAALKSQTADSRMQSLKAPELEEVKNASKYLPSVRNVFLKAFSGKSPAAGIKAKCIQCSAYQKSEITLCRVTDCAIFRYRPYQDVKSSTTEEAEE